MKLRYAFLLAGALLGSSVLLVQGQVPGINSTIQQMFTLMYEPSTMKPTYSATFGLPTAASPTDVCTLTGSATKTIRVRRIIFTGLSSSVAYRMVAVVKRSTANTGGVSLAMTAVPHDSSFAAATATALQYSATNPTTGTLVGVVAEPYVVFGTATSLTPPSAMTIWEAGKLGAPILLRGTSQLVAVNLLGSTLAAGEVTCTFEWSEDNDT